MPNQSAALKAMGFDGRNPDTGKKDRYHNPLVAYTDRVREIFYAECEKQGLVIDREVTSESHRQVEIMAFKLEKARQDVAAAQEQLRQMEVERDEAVRAAQDALKAIQRETDTTQGRLEALRGSEAVLAAKNEHLSEYNTKLEERKAEVIQEGQAIVRENQEARPECVIVAKEDLERVQDQARYNINVHLTEATIKALDKKISENEIIQGLQTQVQQQHMELLHLRGENSRLTQQKQRDDWTIEQLEQTLGAYGIPSPTQQQHHHHRQR